MKRDCHRHVALRVIPVSSVEDIKTSAVEERWMSGGASAHWPRGCAVAGRSVIVGSSSTDEDTIDQARTADRRPRGDTPGVGGIAARTQAPFIPI
jgi:hypothetical protein